jgi:hypothetical protein
MKLKLLALRKSVKKWVFSIFLDNKIADNEARLYFGDDYDSKKE